MEGIVCEKADSRYLIGQRSPQWEKIKCMRDVTVNRRIDASLTHALRVWGRRERRLTYVARLVPALRIDNGLRFRQIL